MKMTAPVGTGLGTQKFSIKPGPGGGLQLDGTTQTPLQAAALAADVGETPVQRLISDRQTETPITTAERAAQPTPFSRLYPGVDPSQVEMALDDKTGKVRFKPIEAPTDTAPEIPQTPAAPVAPVTPSEPDALAQLRAQIAEQSQIQTAMLTALMTGRPLMEVLSGAPAKPAEPDYSRFDLEDEEGRAAYAQAVRADALAAAKAEMQAQMNAHLPSIQNAQKHGERFAVQAEHGADPDYAQKVALTEQLVGNNPNISFKATYNLVSQIQRSLTPATATPAKPSGPTLTPAQAEAKAAQAARYQSTNGGRATGPPEPPPEIAKNFKKLAHWVAQQQALGNL